MKLKTDGTLELYFGPGKHDLKRRVPRSGVLRALTATAKGSTLTISETALCTTTGDYSFTVNGDELSTKVVKDECTSGRPTILGNKAWTRRR